MKNLYINSLIKIFDFSEIKVIIASLLASICTILTSFSENYLGISGSFFIAMAILIISDFFTGILAARKRKDAITSKKGRHSLYKTGAYLLFLYIAFSLKQEVSSDVFSYILNYFHIYIIAHICFWELFSIDENLKVLNIDLGITNMLKNIFSKIKKLSDKEDNDVEIKEDKNIPDEK